MASISRFLSFDGEVKFVDGLRDRLVQSTACHFQKPMCFKPGIAHENRLTGSSNNCLYRNRECQFPAPTLVRKNQRDAAEGALPGVLPPWVIAGPSTDMGLIDPFDAWAVGISPDSQELLSYCKSPAKCPRFVSDSSVLRALLTVEFVAQSFESERTEGSLPYRTTR
jgi:hypothetical protein